MFGYRLNFDRRSNPIFDNFFFFFFFLDFFPLISTLLTIRGLGFKFVDLLCKRSNVCHTEIKML